jgi:hypothetical protein
MKNGKKITLRINKETLRTLSRNDLANIGGAQDSGAGTNKGGKEADLLSAGCGGTGFPTWTTVILNTFSALCGDGGGGGGC